MGAMRSAPGIRVPLRPQVTATVGARPPSGTGLDALLDFHMDVTLEGEPLTAEEMAALLAGTETLALLRGQWVEVDRPRLDRAMRRFKEVQDLAEQELHLRRQEAESKNRMLEEALAALDKQIEDCKTAS